MSAEKPTKISEEFVSCIWKTDLTVNSHRPRWNSDPPLATIHTFVSEAVYQVSQLTAPKGVRTGGYQPNYANTWHPSW